jgi:hypothetical protein
MRVAALKRQRELCTNRGNRIDQITIFDKPEAIDITFFLTVSNMREQLAKQGLGRMANPLLVGCVDYLVGSDSHQTGFIDDILTLGPAGQPRAVFIGQNVPTEGLLFLKFPLGGDYAN